MMKPTKRSNQLIKQPAAKDSLRNNVPDIEVLLYELLKNYPEGSISIVDKDFNFIYTGGRLYEYMGIDPVSLIGKKIFSIFPNSIWNKIRTELCQVFLSNSISNFELPDSFRKGVNYEMEVFPLAASNQAINRVGVIINNITALKKTEANLVQALDKERELGELKSRFVSMASHEFRTPLTTILSSAYLLSKYTTTEDQSKRQKHLERIISSVSSLTDILNDFLSLGKIEEGRISVTLTKFHIAELINAIINEVEPVMKRGQVIQYCHDGNTMITLDKTLLRHIILNLLSNAIKFSNENSVIEIRTQANARFILSVKDHGIGISSKDQNHLFERFFRGSNVINIEGTGLGLHIVSRYAALMNGAVNCNSEIGVGTEFLIDFKQPPGEKYINETYSS